MMRYICTVEAPIQLAKGIEIQFSENLLVSLHCPICKRSHRTVVLKEDESLSYCTPTKHHFPGHVVSHSFISPKSKGFFSNKNIAIASFEIEYYFEKFIDKKYPNRDISEVPTWARIDFDLVCPCGVRKKHSTQNNLGRPWHAVCDCGKILYYEIEEIPKFKNIREKAQQNL